MEEQGSHLPPRAGPLMAACALLALIVWSHQSSLVNLRKKWEPVRDTCFTREPWMREGVPELDRAQLEKSRRDLALLWNDLHELQQPVEPTSPW